MNLTAMLDKCRSQQWRIRDLDWSAEPRALSRDDEIAIVQYFTDMAGIERLAGALFAEQRRRVRDPVLREIFGTFIVDEERHAQVAERLARHYDVHGYQHYELNEHLQRFQPHFVAMIRHVSAEIANAYITTGEMLLDIALLRSLDDFVNDEMSSQAMKLINRDESRHIAIDFHMVEYYCSEEFLRDREREGAKPLRERVKGWWTFCNMLYYAGPFLRDVFFAPMDMCDPSGKRMYEAFKRIQLLASKPGVAARPFTRFLRTLQLLFNHPVLGRVLGGVVVRVAGVDPRVMAELYTEVEQRRAAKMSFQEMAEEAVGAKYALG